MSDFDTLRGEDLSRAGLDALELIKQQGADLLAAVRLVVAAFDVLMMGTEPLPLGELSEAIERVRPLAAARQGEGTP
jgi:hypothetical protein